MKRTVWLGGVAIAISACMSYRPLGGDEAQDSELRAAGGAMGDAKGSGGTGASDGVYLVGGTGGLKFAGPPMGPVEYCIAGAPSCPRWEGAICLGQTPGAEQPGGMAVSAGLWADASGWAMAPIDWGSAGSGPIPPECSALELRIPDRIVIADHEGSWVGCDGDQGASDECEAGGLWSYTLAYTSEQLHVLVRLYRAGLRECSSLVDAFEGSQVWASFDTVDGEHSMTGGSVLRTEEIRTLASDGRRLRIAGSTLMNGPMTWVVSSDPRCAGSCFCGTSRPIALDFDLDLALPLVESP